MRVRRDISSIPQRSASETWQRIVDLVTRVDSADVGQLQRAGGVMASIITDEHPSSRPILLEGVGAQLRIYCRYGLKAVEEGNSVDALTWNPTAGDWTTRITPTSCSPNARPIRSSSVAQSKPTTLIV